VALACSSVVLGLALGWGSVAEGHSGLPAEVGSTLKRDAAPTPPATPRAAVVEAAAPAAIGVAAGAWPWLLLLGLVGIAAAAGRRCPRAPAVALVLLLGIFAGETAVHSVHHWQDPHQAERCPVYSASQHVTGLSAAPATPELAPPPPTLDRPVARAFRQLSWVLDAPQSRAPPALPA
jgi:xanthosine utilization system XapX-like protein